MGLISLVTPSFNEAGNIPEFIERVKDILIAIEARGYGVELVIVDDHSSDNTYEVIRRIDSGLIKIQYVRLSRNCGSHNAIAAGVARCKGDCAVIMAIDLQDPPELIPILIDEWLSGNDVVWAGRSERLGESFSRKLSSKIYWKMMKVFGMPTLPNNGVDVVLVDRRVVDAYNLIQEKHTSIIGMILWLGFRQSSISYVKQARKSGVSKWTLAKKIKITVDSIISFSYVPIRFMTIFGFFTAFAGASYAAVVVVGRMVGWVAAGTGFAALMTVLLVGQGIILMMLGILGEYLWRTFDESRGRPRYIIEQYNEFPE